MFSVHTSLSKSCKSELWDSSFPRETVLHIVMSRTNARVVCSQHGVRPCFGRSSQCFPGPYCKCTIYMQDGIIVPHPDKSPPSALGEVSSREKKDQ